MSSVAQDVAAPALTKKGNATRKALLDSTIELIASTGYAATTTQAVLDHSGISRGSLLHQFKTREHLMVAAALEAVERMFVGVSEGLADVADPIEALRQYPVVLWGVQNEAPARAFAELQLASRWEKGLQVVLQPAVKEINERIRSEVKEIAAVNGLGNVGNLVAEVGALISAMQGLAISVSLVEDQQETDQIVEVLTGHYRSSLERSITR